MKIPVILHLHGSEFEKWYDSVSVKKQEKIRLLLKECDAMIVLGEKWNEIIKRIEPDCNTVVIENSISTSEYTVKWNSEICRFLFMGVLIKRKGVQDLILAAKNVVDQHPEKKFIIEIAGVGEEEDTLKKLVRRYQLESFFEFSGWVEGKEKIDCYKRSNIMILPSYNEGLPVAILEAISYGLPVIATNVGDISSAVEDGKNGYLVNPGDVVGIADAIVKILDCEVYERFSKHSKKLAEERFSDKKFFGMLRKLYMGENIQDI